ncbi:NupC/NupG family nucleoside CNT transporter [Thermocoleostomius sinensis]|uniref:Nucleoside:proton symporter n=1 Tax=Thermocoleostomius sinensis A174 TaxID=2016057 RepID=A0A9E8ZA26_9CYAN|nr:nucleoside transporter C-terminal domain-containing protein [Thermocoleostomius sinensis]WAL59335.1 nucleoside:proton symporter [Thermocoleostomius sinensis A174]
MISLIGIFGLCAIAWLFSENRDPKYFPWRVVMLGLLFQFAIGFVVFVLPQLIPQVRDLLIGLGSFLNLVFEAADAGARFVFGRNLVPFPGQDTFFLSPLPPGTDSCTADSAGQVVPGFCGIRLGYIYAFRALPAIIFVSGLVALLYRLGVIQGLVRLFAALFHRSMHLSGAESLSGVTNIFLGIEAAIVIKPYLPRMTRSELCAVLACCFGTATSATLPAYVGLLQPIFPNVSVHLIAASIMAIPACFLLSKILVPETAQPSADWKAKPVVTESAWIDRPDRSTFVTEPVAEPMDTTIDTTTVDLPDATIPEISIRQPTPTEAAIEGAIEGVKIAAAIVAGLIMVLGLTYFVVQLANWLATLPNPVGGWFRLVSLPNILGALSLPFTVLTGVSLRWEELWQCSLLLGRRLLETAIVPYQSVTVSVISGSNTFSDRAVLLLSYALSGFAHLAYWGIVVGGVFALLPWRRKEVIGLCWKALLAGALATYMIACVAGFFDGIFGTSTLNLLGKS